MPVSWIFVAPGNGGTAYNLHNVSNIAIAVDDFTGLVDFAIKNNINLVVPGKLFLELFLSTFDFSPSTGLHA